MFEFLYEAIYILFIASLALNFMIARFMSFVNIGEAKYLSTIIGTALGWLTFFVTPALFAGIIVGALATIAANIVLTRVVYPKFDEKAHDIADNVEARIDRKTQAEMNNDFDMALYSSTSEERVKYLSINMRNNYFYCFQFAVDSDIVFRTAKEAIEMSGFSSEYPEVRRTVGNEMKTLMFSVNTDVQAAGICFTPATMNRRDVYMLGIYVYADDGKLRERTRFEKKIGHLLDKLYLIFGHVIKNIDSESTVDIVPFKAPF